jgi:ElaB/YqjD/DUF883 family membrane-anchored ribosome-binding protein
MTTNISTGIGGSSNDAYSAKREAGKAVDHASAAASDASTAVRKEASDLYQDLSDLVRNPRLAEHPEVQALRAKLDRGVNYVRSSVTEAGTKVRAQTGRAVTAADGYAHDQPWKVAGVAALVGLLAGVLIARR